jgi:hypothetical protein
MSFFGTLMLPGWRKTAWTRSAFDSERKIYLLPEEVRRQQ